MCMFISLTSQISKFPFMYSNWKFILIVFLTLKLSQERPARSNLSKLQKYAALVSCDWCFAHQMNVFVAWKLSRGHSGVCVCVSTWRCAAMKNDKVINVVNDKEGFLLSIGSFSQCLNEVPVLHKGHSHAKNRSTQSHSTHTRTPTFIQVNIYSYLLFYIRQILSLPHSVSPPIISHFICQTIVCVSVGMKLFNVVNSHDARS